MWYVVCAYVYVCVHVCIACMTWHVCMNVHVRGWGWEAEVDVGCLPPSCPLIFVEEFPH